MDLQEHLHPDVSGSMTHWTLPDTDADVDVGVDADVDVDVDVVEAVHRSGFVPVISHCCHVAEMLLRPLWPGPCSEEVL